MDREFWIGSGSATLIGSNKTFEINVFLCNLLLEGRSWIRIRKAKKRSGSRTQLPVMYTYPRPWPQFHIFDRRTVLIELKLFLEMRLPRKPRKNARRWRMTSKRSTRKTCKSLNGERDKSLNGEGVLHRPL
jgi:hypothetical protein